MHKKMLSILLLVGALGLAVCPSVAAATTLPVDIYTGTTDPGNALGGDGTTNAASATNKASGNTATVAGNDSAVAIGSSQGSGFPTAGAGLTGAWNGAVLPGNALELLSVGGGTHVADFANLFIGGVNANLTDFDGTSANFALKIGTVKSAGDMTDASTNVGITVAIGGKARWVRIDSLTAESATVKGSSTTDAAWSALDGNVLDIGTFTAATDAASTLTATAGTGNALLRVGAIDVGLLANVTTLTLAATGTKMLVGAVTAGGRGRRGAKARPITPKSTFPERQLQASQSLTEICDSYMVSSCAGG